MSTTAEIIQSIQTNLSNAYTSLENKGATIPENKNIENLASAIDSIETSGGSSSGTDFLQWKCDNVKSLKYEFAGYKGTDLPDLTIRDTSQVTLFSYMFQSCSNLTSIPQFDTSNGTNFDNMFDNCTKITSIPQFDTGNGKMFGGMFQNCSQITSIPQLDTSNGTSFTYMFSGCINLTTISGLDLRSATSYNYTFFNNCVKLTNLTLKNIKKSGLTIGSGTSYGHLLTVDSLVNTIKELWDYSSGTTTYTLTMGTTNTAKLTDVYVKLITPTAEQIEADPYIESKMPCEVCASTDEGAMLITDYATLKKWTIS